MDKSYAEKFVEQILTFFYTECKNNAVGLFNSKMAE